MLFIDSHSHIYLPQFDSDRDQVVQNAKEVGVHKILLPNIDSSSVLPMLMLCKKFPGTCYPMIGLHPTSVKNGFEKELDIIEKWIEKESFIAIGECGIDLYWDKTFAEQQKQVFKQHIKLALKYKLPLVIHARDSFEEIYEVLGNNWEEGLKGVFHSFTGNEDDIKKINDFGFMFGINGIVTFKNAELKNVIKHIDLNKLLIETDSPYLAPVPKRGKRNESAYVVNIAQKISELLGIDLKDIASITTQNAKNLFQINE